MISCYDIKNALTDKHLPLSNNIHCPYCMMPSDLIKYMFESLQMQIGGGKIHDDID